jgi:opacity protein-like surface antigen
MRKFAIGLAIASVIGVANGAQAADLRDYGGSMKDAPYEAAPAIWSGLYVGGHIGGLWNDGGDSSIFKKKKKCYTPPALELAATTVETESAQECNNQWEKVDYVKFSDDDDDTTLIGGVHIGYNWQSGSKVFGIEADASFGDGVDYLASLRARLGYAMDALLVYATAGVAFVGFDDKTIDAKFGEYYTHSFDVEGDSEVGVVVGLGAEYKLAANWSVGVEGLYYFFGDSDSTKEWDWWCYNKKFTHDDDNDMFVVRGRLSYHFTDDRYDAPLK